MRHQDTDKYFKSHDRGSVLRHTNKELAEVALRLTYEGYDLKKAIELVTNVFKPTVNLAEIIEKMLDKKIK